MLSDGRFKCIKYKKVLQRDKEISDEDLKQKMDKLDLEPTSDSNGICI